MHPNIENKYKIPEMLILLVIMIKLRNLHDNLASWWWQQPRRN